MHVTTLTVACALLFAPVAAADELEDAFQSLKQAESKKDAAQVKELAAKTFALARKTTESTGPEGEEDEAAWKSRVAYAKGIEVQAEYALYATAVQSTPAVMVDLIAALEQQRPKSRYLDQAYGAYCVALSQTGAAAKVPGVAEKALANFPENEDLLLILADNAVARKQNDRALNYATRLTNVLSRHSKPEGVSAAEWERKRSASLGRGYWIAGVIHAEGGVFAPADKELRSALPFIKGNDSMMGPALFYLGVANYNLGKMTLNKAKVLEGAKFSEDAAAIPGSPLAHQAWKNAMVMKTEAGKMR